MATEAAYCILDFVQILSAFSGLANTSREPVYSSSFVSPDSISPSASPASKAPVAHLVPCPSSSHSRICEPCRRFHLPLPHRILLGSLRISVVEVSLRAAEGVLLCHCWFFLVGLDAGHILRGRILGSLLLRRSGNHRRPFHCFGHRRIHFQLLYPGQLFCSLFFSWEEARSASW